MHIDHGYCDHPFLLLSLSRGFHLISHNDDILITPARASSHPGETIRGKARRAVWMRAANMLIEIRRMSRRKLKMMQVRRHWKQRDVDARRMLTRGLRPSKPLYSIAGYHSPKEPRVPTVEGLVTPKQRRSTQLVLRLPPLHHQSQSHATPRDDACLLPGPPPRHWTPHQGAAFFRCCPLPPMRRGARRAAAIPPHQRGFSRTLLPFRPLSSP